MSLPLLAAGVYACLAIYPANPVLQQIQLAWYHPHGVSVGHTRCSIPESEKRLSSEKSLIEKSLISIQRREQPVRWPWPDARSASLLGIIGFRTEQHDLWPQRLRF
jgi:hypothetical protein